MSCIHLACTMPEELPRLCRLHPEPCNLLVLWQLRHSLTSQPQCFRKTKTLECKHLCEANASSSKRFPLIALLMASAPRQHYFFIQSRKHTRSKQSTSYTVFFHSDQRAIHCVLLPCPCTLQSTSVASKRVHGQNTG